LANPHASIALESGSQPLIAECIARHVLPPYSGDLVAAFHGKYEWDISKDDDYNGLFALTPVKWLAWNA
jgi:hypothetical protein